MTEVLLGRRFELIRSELNITVQKDETLTMLRPSYFNFIPLEENNGTTINCLGSCIMHLTGIKSFMPYLEVRGGVTEDMKNYLEEVSGFTVLELSRFNGRKMNRRLKNAKAQNRKRKMNGHEIVASTEYRRDMVRLDTSYWKCMQLRGSFLIICSMIKGGASTHAFSLHLEPNGFSYAYDAGNKLTVLDMSRVCEKIYVTGTLREMGVEKILNVYVFVRKYLLRIW